ncbi:MAG TPA: hypothetical protein VMT30_05680 [Candidatus Saccharimonadia bacterium]|nr:hypothetical protein [Candidatus Saccharimonadia bacterium]
MNFSAPFFALSPDDPYWISLWAHRYHTYEAYTGIFLVVLILAFVVLTILARRTQDLKRRKRLWLARKLGTYLAIVGWGLFVAYEFGLIQLP